MKQTVINVVKDTNGGTRPALLYLPDDYGTSKSLYSFIYFGHGIGEAGTDLSKIYNNPTAGGPAYFIEQGTFPSSFINPADGNQYKFIILSPQAISGSTTASELIQILKWMAVNYRIDTNRIYITGLSAGGGCVVEYITHYNNATGKTDLPILQKVAAAIPMSAQMGQPSQQMINNIIADGTDVWGFGSMTDGLGIQTRVLVQGAFGGNGGSATGIGALGRFTSYTGGHCCWGQFYNPAYTEVINGKTINIYQWLLQFSKGVTAQPPITVPPVTPPPVIVPPVVIPPKTIKSITITYSDGSQEIKP